MKIGERWTGGEETVKGVRARDRTTDPETLDVNTGGRAMLEDSRVSMLKGRYERSGWLRC